MFRDRGPRRNKPHKKQPMPTNPIGTGTRNLSVNCPTDEAAEIGKLAFRLGFKSVGDFMRHLVMRGLEQQDADAAEKVAAIRKSYYGTIQLILFIAAIVWCHDDARRCRNRVRCSRCVEIIEEA